jgi:hypothetical protein
MKFQARDTPGSEREQDNEPPTDPAFTSGRQPAVR